MFLLSVTIDHYVVKIYHYKLIKVWLEDTVHEHAKCGWSVGEAERHDPKLVCLIYSHINNRWLISFRNPLLIVPPILN